MKEYLASTILRDLEVPFLRSFRLDSENFMAFSKVDGKLLSLDGQKEIHKKRGSTAPLESLLLSHALAFHYIILSEAGGGVCYSADFS